jgi:hypothetical protein
LEEEQIDYLCKRQTPHRSGMLVALVAGSVRQIAPDISPTKLASVGGEKAVWVWELPGE